ncbi:MAG: hypothetical protein ACF8QF_10880 [Phycisphaerales bacterium]
MAVLLVAPAAYIAIGIYFFVLRGQPSHPPGSMAFVPVVVFWLMMGVVVVVAVATALVGQRNERSIFDARTATGGVATLGPNQLTVPTASIAAVEIVSYAPPIGPVLHCGISAVVLLADGQSMRVPLLGGRTGASKQHRLAHGLAKALSIPCRDGERYETDCRGVFHSPPDQIRTTAECVAPVELQLRQATHDVRSFIKRQWRVSPHERFGSVFVVERDHDSRPVVIGRSRLGPNLRMMLPSAALIGTVFALLFLPVYFEGQPGQPGPFGFRTHHWPSAIAGSGAIGLGLFAFFCLLAAVDRVTGQPRVLLTGTVDQDGVLDLNFIDRQVARREIMAVELIRTNLGARWAGLAWLPIVRSIRYTQGIALVISAPGGPVRRIAGVNACAPMGIDRRLARQLADILVVPLRDGHAGEVDEDGRFLETPRELVEPAA